MIDWLIMLKIMKICNQTKFCFTKKINKDLVAIHEIKPVLTLDKTIYVGFNVLDLSKLLKYDFHYNYIKKKYDAELLFTDKDSLTYKIKREENFYKDKNLFNFSNYPKYSKFFYHSTIKEIGKMKDESEEKIIIDFV